MKITHLMRRPYCLISENFHVIGKSEWDASSEHVPQRCVAYSVVVSNEEQVGRGGIPH